MPLNQCSTFCEKVFLSVSNCRGAGALVSKMACLPVVFRTVQFSTEVLRSVTLPYAVESARTALNLQGAPLRLSVFTLVSLDPVWFNIRLYGGWYVLITLLQGLNWGCKSIFSFRQGESISSAGTDSGDK